MANLRDTNLDQAMLNGAILKEARIYGNKQEFLRTKGVIDYDKVTILPVEVK